MNRLLPLGLVLFSSAAPLPADPLKLAPSAPADLIPNALVAPKIASVERHAERELVQFSWPVEESAGLELTPAPFTAESREFWTTVEAGELAKGFAFTTTAPGALIRLSPAEGGKAAGLDLSGLRLEVAGRAYGREGALAVLADAGELKRAGAEFPEGTVAFRLRSELGFGPTRLILPKASGRVLVHVFEPASKSVLRLSASPFVGADGQLALQGDWQGLGKATRIATLAGLVTAPNGRSWNFELKPAGDAFAGAVPLSGIDGLGEGLWEVHLFGLTAGAEGDVRRDVRTAFSVSVPSARLLGPVAREELPDALILAPAVEVALAGRYELRALITGTAADGSERPLAVSHAALWLEPGQGQIPLRIEKAHLARAGIGAPFGLRDLRLIRQGDQNLQERRERALDWR
jgi:hypothetical protein